MPSDVPDEVVFDEGVGNVLALNASDATLFDPVPPDDVLAVFGQEWLAVVLIPDVDSDGVDLTDRAVFDDPVMPSLRADGTGLGAGESIARVLNREPLDSDVPQPILLGGKDESVYRELP